MYDIISGLLGLVAGCVVLIGFWWLRGDFR